MKNQYKLKDKKAMLYRRADGGVNARGFALKDTFTPVAAAPIWCYVRQLSQQDVIQSEAFGQKETRLFVFNFYPNINIRDRVEYKDKWYEVTRVDTTDDYNGDLFVYVKDSENPLI